MCEAQIYIKKHLKTEKITLIRGRGGVVASELRGGVTLSRGCLNITVQH